MVTNIPLFFCNSMKAITQNTILKLEKENENKHTQTHRQYEGR